MMGLREFVELFDKNEVKNLFNALSSCIEYVRIDLHVFNIGAYVTCLYSNDLESLSQTEGCNVNMIIEVPHLFEAFMEYASPEMKCITKNQQRQYNMKEEVERIKKLVGIDHNRWEQPCTCDKCKNMCEVPCIGTPKDIEAIIDAGYADRLKETMWMVGYLAVKEKPIAMIQPTVKDGWCAFRQPDGLCELHDRGLKPTEGVLASCKVVEEDDIPTYETSVLRAVAHEWVKVENFGNVMKVVFKFLHENERRK